MLLNRVINTINYKAQTVLLSTPPLHKLKVKGGADVREKKEINVRIGNQIRIAREAAGLTQDRFAELVSLATKNVSDIERGVVGVSIGSLIRICQTLSISSDSILFGEEIENDVHGISDRLSKLPSEQFEIAVDIMNKLFEALLHRASDLSGWLPLPLFSHCFGMSAEKFVVILPMFRRWRIAVNQLHPLGQFRVVLDGVFQPLHAHNPRLIVIQA